ncbi:MAG TPA: thiamine pyrophosphate-requiring protein [Chloroflexota bacterium]
MKGAAVVAEALKGEGVDTFFCFPQNPLIDALAAAGIRPIVCRQERVGVNMADGYSRTSKGKRIGVFVMQSGPGAENSYAGVAQAFANGIPMLLLPGGTERRRMDVLPNFWAARNFTGVTKWATTVPTADRIPDLVRRAFYEMRTGRPGPVMLEVPADVAVEEMPDEQFNYEPAKPLRSMGDPGDVRSALDALLAAREPVIHAGQGVLFADASAELVELAELLRIPVLTTLNGKSAFPEDHPLALGAGSTTTTAALAHFLKKADVVFGVGCSLSRTSFGVTIPPGKVMIHTTNNEWDINKDYRADHAILGDTRLVLQQLIDEIKSRRVDRSAHDGVAAELAGVKEHWLAEWMPRLTADEVPLNPYRVIWDLMHNIDRRNAIVTHDSGGPRNQIIPFWEAIEPGSYIGWGKSTQLGFSLGATMGAKLAAPDKLCMHLMGDAAIGMVGMDLETAVRAGIGILTIVLNNGTMAAETHSTAVAEERFSALTQGGDYSLVAKGLGAWSERVTQPAEIVPALQRAVEVTQSGCPAVLEFITKAETAASRPMAG